MPGAFMFVFSTLLLSLLRMGYALDYDLFIDDPSIIYLPSSPLSSTACSVSLAYNEECTGNWWRLRDGVPSSAATVLTWGPSTNLIFNFTGTGIELYGRIMPEGAGFFAGVDDEPMQWYSSSDTRDDFEILLFERQPLLLGLHTVRLVYDDESFSSRPQSRRFLGLDVWTVRGAPDDDDGTIPTQAGNHTSSTNSTTPSTGDSKSDKSSNRTNVLGLGEISDLDDTVVSHSSGLSPVAIGALVAVLAVTVLLSSLAAFVFFRRRKQILAERMKTVAVGAFAFTHVTHKVDPEVFTGSATNRVGEHSTSPSLSDKPVTSWTMQRSERSSPPYPGTIV